LLIPHTLLLCGNDQGHLVRITENVDMIWQFVIKWRWCSLHVVILLLNLAANRQPVKTGKFWKKTLKNWRHRWQIHCYGVK
jgi:hypothetical protein